MRVRSSWKKVLVSSVRKNVKVGSINKLWMGCRPVFFPIYVERVQRTFCRIDSIFLLTLSFGRTVSELIENVHVLWRIILFLKDSITWYIQKAVIAFVSLFQDSKITHIIYVAHRRSCLKKNNFETNLVLFALHLIKIVVGGLIFEKCRFVMTKLFKVRQ